MSKEDRKWLGAGIVACVLFGLLAVPLKGELKIIEGTGVWVRTAWTDTSARDWFIHYVDLTDTDNTTPTIARIAYGDWTTFAGTESEVCVPMVVELITGSGTTGGAVVFGYTNPKSTRYSFPKGGRPMVAEDNYVWTLSDTGVMMGIYRTRTNHYDVND